MFFVAMKKKQRRQADGGYGIEEEANMARGQCDGDEDETIQQADGGDGDEDKTRTTESW